MQLPDEAVVTCADTDDCPAGMRCIVELAVCVRSDAADTTPPTLANVQLTPSVGGAATTFTLAFTAEPLIVAPEVFGSIAGQSVPWTSTGRDGDAYTYELPPSPGLSDGVMQVSVRLVDLAGNGDTAPAGSVTLDFTGPTIAFAGLVITSAPQGMNDTVSGDEGATEAGAAVAVYADALLSDLLASTTANSFGGFDVLSLGDNSTDMRADGLVGQELFWLVATDSLGNLGNPVPVTTDVAPPSLSVTAIKRLESEWGVPPEVWVDALVFRAGDKASGRVRLLADTNLNEMPTVRVGETDATCQLASLSASGGVFHCDFTPDADALEDTPLDVVATAVSAGAQNISRATGPEVSYDFTNPSAPDPDLIDVQMEPVGTPDTLVLNAGAVEPRATVVVFTTSSFFDQFGSFGCVHETIATGVADGLGALVLDLGDNEVGGAEVRQVDAAGNDPCSQCIYGVGCLEATPIFNDVVGPSVSMHTLTRELSSATTARFSFVGSDADGTVPQVYCQLDANPDVTCGDFVVNNLGAGLHTLSYRATDLLGNSSTPQSFEWQVLPTVALTTSPRYGELTGKGYLVDGSGAGHLFVGGSGLHHFVESTPGVFTYELLLSEPVTAVMAARSGSTLYAVMQRGDRAKAYDVLLGTYSGASWTFEVLQRGLAPAGGIDLALDTDGAPVVLVPRCRSADAQSCLSGGPGYRNYELLLIKRAASGALPPNIATNTHKAHQPRMAINSTGHVWLFYREEASNGAKTLWVQRRQGSAWDTPIQVTGAGSPSVSSSLFNVFPGLTLGPGGFPAVSYTPNNGNIWSALYDGASFTFQNLGRGGGYSTMPDATGALWYAFAAPPTIVRRDTSTTWSTDAVTATYASTNSPALVTPGSFASSVFHLAAQVRSGANSSLERTEHDSGDTTVAVAAQDGYQGFATVEGMEAVVVAASNSMTLRSHTGGVWAAPSTVRADLGRRGMDPSAVSGGGTTWVAHGSLDDSSNSSQRVVVERNTGSGFTTVGAISTDGVSSENPTLSLTAANVPVVAYVQSNGTAQIFLTWWTGSAFATPTSVLTLTAGWQVSSLGLIGDAGSGSSMLVFGDTVNNSVRAVTFTIASENTGVAGCESCSIATVTGANQAFVAAGRSPTSQPQVMVSSSDVGLVLFTYSAGWSSRDIRSELVAQSLSSQGAWEDAAQNCFSSGASSYGPVAFTYDNNDRLRLHGRFFCYPLGTDDLEMFAVEGASSFRAFPIATSSNDYIDFTRGILMSASDEATIVWGDPDAGVVMAFDEGDL